jgi:hypothetical protein
MKVTSAQILSGATKNFNSHIKVEKWSYGVMTVPSRRETLLPRTLASLVAAGFPTPRLFVDGCDDPSGYTAFGLQMTLRMGDPGRVACNWSAGMVELYCRDPQADAYVMFQDDVVACRDLRQYLERSRMPINGYYNLYTGRKNQRRMSILGHRKGWYTSNQGGIGALALVFPKDVLMTLFMSHYFVTRPQDENGHKAIDGGIVSALKPLGKKEYVHLPSLVQHTGQTSTLGHYQVEDKDWDPESTCFFGEDRSALDLLK